MNKEVHSTDNQLHNLIVLTVNEQYNEDDHYGIMKYSDEGDSSDEQINNWGMW